MTIHQNDNLIENNGSPDLHGAVLRGLSKPPPPEMAQNLHEFSMCMRGACDSVGIHVLYSVRDEICCLEACRVTAVASGDDTEIRRRATVSKPETSFLHSRLHYHSEFAF